MPIPNFFIVGAPKAGTDLLYYELDQHPEIYMSPLKEPCFYSSEIRRENFDAQIQEQMSQAEEATRQYIAGPMQQKRFGGVVSRREDYERLFAGVHQEKAIGEGSVCYLWSSTAPYAIARDNPKARIVIVLMDPAERAFHQYLKSVSDGTVRHAFHRHLDLAMACDQQKLGIFHPFLAFGNYAGQVRRYRECFPAAQIHLSLYEETQTDRGTWLAHIFAFLGVNSGFRPGPVEVPSIPHVPRFAGLSHALRLRQIKDMAKQVLPKTMLDAAKKKRRAREHILPALAPEDRARLVGYYREDILRLQDLISRDLSAWLQ